MIDFSFFFEDPIVRVRVSYLGNTCKWTFLAGFFPQDVTAELCVSNRITKRKKKRHDGAYVRYSIMSEQSHVTTYKKKTTSQSG